MDYSTKAGRLNSNVMVGKFTALVRSAGTYVDGVDVPSGANAGPVAGIADESILPNGYNDYSGGIYQVTSGTSWPSNVIPSSATGRGIALAYKPGDRIYAVCAAVSGGIAVGDRLNIADSQGRLKKISEAAGTTVYEVGEALEASDGTAGRVIKIQLTLVKRVV